MRVVISLNPKPCWGVRIAKPKTGQILSNLSVEVLEQKQYRPNSEAHMLHLLQWFIADAHHENSYLWFLTDNDPLIPSGMAAMVDHLRGSKPDVLFMNNVWAEQEER